MSHNQHSTVALLYPGDQAARERADPTASRFAMLFEAFATEGIKAVPAVYHDDFADDVAAQLRDVDAVLRLGTKDVLYDSGIGVWRVEATTGGELLVRHAQRGCTVQRTDLAAWLETLAPYFEPEAGGHMIDQAWQPRLSEGMVRAYLVEDRVAGFGHQAVNALHPDELQPGPRLYHGPELGPFQGLRQRLESGWITQLRECVGLASERLPLLWDCDFMFGEPGADGSERYVLCEINVSSVSPFPPSCVAPLVRAVRRRLSA